MEEWAATSMGTLMHPMSRSFNTDSNSASTSMGPATTHNPGAFTAATLNVDGIKARASASPSDTLSMPPGARHSKSRPRSATNATALATSSTPDRQAATYSPTL